MFIIIKEIKKSGVISVIMALLLVVSSCGRDVTEGDNLDELEDGTLIVRENVNEINIAVSGFDTFNPIMTQSASVAEFMKTVCEPLFEYDDAYNPIGVLAKNYAVSSNGRSVSFEVEPVKFHDSKTLTADDVVYTIEMVCDNDTLYSDSAKYIDEVFVGDDGRVYITLVKPVVNFAGLLNFPIVKKGTPAEIDANYVPVGTGPCQYSGKKSANQITFTANMDWHEGETGFKNVIVTLLKDNFTTVHSFDAGEVDVIASELTKGEEITPRGEYSINQYTSNSLVFLGINNYSGKLSGKWTRKALELLCDKKKIVDVEVYSRGEIVSLPINPSAWFYPQLPEAARDYETVNSILARDGWVRGESGFYRDNDGERQELKLKLLVHKDNEEKVRIAQNIADTLTSFGIETTLRQFEFDVYKSEVADKNYELFIGEVLMDKSMDPGFLTDSADNYFGYSNQNLDGVLDAMAKTADGNAIREEALRYAEIFLDETPFVPLFFRKENVIYNKYISGVVMPNVYHLYRDIDKWYISRTK